MIWVCRAGQHSKYYDEFILNSRVYLAWEGYKINLQMLSSREEFNQVVIREKIHRLEPRLRIGQDSCTHLQKRLNLMII